jgi:hypothetical protein
MGSVGQWTILSVSVWGEGEGKPSWAGGCAPRWSGHVRGGGGGCYIFMLLE